MCLSTTPHSRSIRHNACELRADHDDARNGIDRSRLDSSDLPTK